MSESNKTFRNVGCTLAGCVLVMIAVLIYCLPVMVYPKSVVYLTECKSHFKQLGLALENYHDTYHSFPPAIIRDEQGRPFLSWRTLVLPFVEQVPLYHKYNLAEPWDSPHNSRLLTSAIEVFRCPANHNDLQQPTTNYVAVIGPNTVWRSDGTTVSRKDITDGVSNTILLVETREAGIHIFEPRDLSLDQMVLTINSEHGQGISSHHVTKKNQSIAVHALMCDGTVRRLSDNLSSEVLYAMLTINGGERFDTSGNEWRLVR